MSSYDLVVRGTLVLPERITLIGWLAIADGKIAAIGSGTAPRAAVTFDADAGFVLPGVIDGQTHATSYRGTAGFEATTRSAIAGGVTTLVDMPYDNPEPLTTLAHLERKADAVGHLALCDVALYGTVAPGQGTGAMVGLARAGICALKISSFESHPVRFPRIPADEVLDILEASVDLQLPVGLHNEDQEIVRGRIKALANAGKNAAAWHTESRPVAAELAATAAFLELGAVTGAHVHLVHLSNPRGYQLVARYREEGFKATAELCVHYLHFDADVDIARLGARMKVNPPIRGGMLDGLWRELVAGHVEFVSSDHSSWPIDNKLTQSIFDAGAGIPGLETLVPSFYTDLCRRALNPIGILAEQLAERPAKFFGLWPRKGGLIEGADADIMILRPGQRKFSEKDTHDGLNWSPYDGEIFDAQVSATFLRGKLVWDGTDILGVPGDGTYVRRLNA